MEKQFTEADIKKLQNLMNLVITRAEFRLSINDFVDVWNSLEWVKTDLIPKMSAHIFEVKSVKKKTSTGEP